MSSSSEAERERRERERREREKAEKERHENTAAGNEWRKKQEEPKPKNTV